jgi:hypothetical protein
LGDSFHCPYGQKFRRTAKHRIFKQPHSLFLEMQPMIRHFNLFDFRKFSQGSLSNFSILKEKFPVFALLKTEMEI